MGIPLKAFDNKHSDEQRQTNVLQLVPTPAVPVADGIHFTSVSLSGFKNSTEKKDSKLVDFLLIGILTLFIHNQVIDHFRGSAFDQTLPKPEKQPPKVTITFYKPPPKPVPPPPVVKPAPPPPPKVVALKPPKEKPKPKPEVVPEVYVPENAVYRNEPPAPPAPAPAPVVEEKITLPVAGDYLHNPEPEYPNLAADRGWTGKVLLQVHVLADGTAGAVKIKKSSGYKILDDAAATAVNKWKFTPAKRGDTPIDFWYDVPINFV